MQQQQPVSQHNGRRHRAKATTISIPSHTCSNLMPKIKECHSLFTKHLTARKKKNGRDARKKSQEKNRFEGETSVEAAFSDPHTALLRSEYRKNCSTNGTMFIVPSKYHRDPSSASSLPVFTLLDAR